LFEVIGYAAAALTAVAFLPQVLKTIKTRQTRDLSLVTLIAQCTGVALYVAYAIYLRALPMILGNIVTLALMGTLLVYKLQERGARSE
jgi:MtN3 and saliva related transmembrane protein